MREQLDSFTQFVTFRNLSLHLPCFRIFASYSSVNAHKESFRLIVPICDDYWNEHINNFKAKIPSSSTNLSFICRVWFFASSNQFLKLFIASIRRPKFHDKLNRYCEIVRSQRRPNKNTIVTERTPSTKAARDLLRWVPLSRRRGRFRARKWNS